MELCLGLWQIIKLTSVGALILGAIGWFLRSLLFFLVYVTGMHVIEGRRHLFSKVVYVLKTNTQYRDTALILILLWMDPR